MQFDAVVDACAARYRLAYLYLNDAQTAEDIVQDAFLRYWRAAATVQTPQAWLQRVVRNLSLNKLRQRQREQQVDPLALPEEAGAALEDSVTAALHMSDALLRLPLAYREVLLWRYYLQVPDDELASQLGLSAAGVRTRLMRARQALARLLREENR